MMRSDYVWQVVMSSCNGMSLLIETSIEVNHWCRTWFTPPHEYLLKKVRKPPDSHVQLQKHKEITTMVIALLAFASWCISKLLLHAILMKTYYRLICFKKKLLSSKTSASRPNQSNASSTNCRRKRSKFKKHITKKNKL